MFLSIEKENKEINENDSNDTMHNKKDENKNRVILGYISNGLP